MWIGFVWLKTGVEKISCKHIYELVIGGYSLCILVNVDWIHVVGDRK